MSIILPIAHSATAASIENLQVLQYAFLAPNALLFYDHALTFASEVEQIWCRKLTLQSFLFLFLRYISPFQALFFSLSIFPFVSTLPKRCIILIRIPPIMAIFQTASIGGKYCPISEPLRITKNIVALGIMIIRIYALYERNKHVAIFLLFLLVAQIIVMGTLIGSVKFSMGPHGCTAVEGGNYITFFWWSPVVLDTVIFIFTISRLHHYRKIRERVSIFRILLRDGIMYYVIICSLNIINALFILFAKPDLKPVGISLGISISAAITSRLVLNLRNAQSSMGTERSNPTEQDGVLTTIPFIYITPPDFDTYPLHDFPHQYHDNNSWYTNETSDVDARKDQDDLGTKATIRGSTTLHTPALFSYSITEWT